MEPESCTDGEQVAAQMTLDDIVRFTREMLTSAQAGEWERVTEMEEARRDNLKLLFGVMPDESERQAWKAAAEELVAMDKELERLAGLAQEEIAASAKKLSASRQAVKVYSQNI